MYSPSSYARQQSRRPHWPEIFDGLSDRFCRFAMAIEIGLKSFSQVEQQRVRPQMPMPPIRPASSRAPTCCMWTRAPNRCEVSRTSWRKSTRCSAVK